MHVGGDSSAAAGHVLVVLAVLAKKKVLLSEDAGRAGSSPKLSGLVQDTGS
jgi:hypothetical protein